MLAAEWAHGSPIGCISMNGRRARWAILASAALENLDADLERAGIELWIARANEPLRDLLEVTGLTKRLGKENIYSSVRAAVAAYHAR